MAVCVLVLMVVWVVGAACATAAAMPSDAASAHGGRREGEG